MTRPAQNVSVAAESVGSDYQDRNAATVAGHPDERRPLVWTAVRIVCGDPACIRSSVVLLLEVDPELISAPEVSGAVVALLVHGGEQFAYVIAVAPLL